MRCFDGKYITVQYEKARKRETLFIVVSFWFVLTMCVSVYSYAAEGSCYSAGDGRFYYYALFQEASTY